MTGEKKRETKRGIIGPASGGRRGALIGTGGQKRANLCVGKNPGGRGVRRGLGKEKGEQVGPSCS